MEIQFAANTKKTSLCNSNTAAEAFLALGINASVAWSDFHQWPYWPDDYDMLFLGSSFNGFDVNWLAYEYWSENANHPYTNMPRWRNSSYDSWRTQLLNSSTYEEVYEAAIEMQHILVYECPIVVAYVNMLLSAYRTDRFEGFVNSMQGGVLGWWTNYKVHLKQSEGGPFGGTIRWSNPLDVDSFNFMVTSSSYSMKVLEMTHDSLIRQGLDGLDMMWLAKSYTIETHEDNPAIFEGETRFTFQLVENATWSDGTRLTGEDVAFTLKYYCDSPGNPYGKNLEDMKDAYAPNPFAVVIDFESESYWHLHDVGYKPILPKHVFQEIGLDGWNLYNPNPPIDAMVTSGPFNVSHYEASEYVEISRNPFYFYGPVIPSPTTTTTPPEPVDPRYYLFGTIAGVFLCVIVIVMADWTLKKNR
ncbi:MAG: ABC transporter substrate-binding protein [Candidatus Thorarchaeota archaeon]|nr:ABC transporter substrate-binding protein [Candidatus Thorarchaeota archaeon]